MASQISFFDGSAVFAALRRAATALVFNNTSKG
jgi:hypothetical protein